MNLTLEQQKSIEDAFNSYPPDYEPNPKYGTMEGIKEQLESPHEKDGMKMIFYISNVKLNEELEAHSFSINKVIEED